LKKEKKLKEGAMGRFGRYLRELRESTGMRIKKLADELGWTAVYISDIELGRRNPPSAEKIIKIASVIGVDSTKLLDLADQEKKKVVLDLDEERPSRVEVALMLARSWDGLTDDEVAEMKELLNRRAKK
jgi:HTH-type transcriptional regulator, competence development regulator